MTAAALTHAVPDYDAKLYSASQTMDEARHVEVYERYIRKLAQAYPISPWLKDLIDVTLYDGEISSKTVRIIADVVTPDDQNVQETLDIEIQRAELVGDDGTPLTGRWIITAIDEVG